MVLETTPLPPATEAERAFQSMAKSYAMYDELAEKAKQDEISETERAIYERMPGMVKEAELKLITKNPEFDEAYTDILKYQERVHALHDIIGKRRDLIRFLAIHNELADQKYETERYAQHMSELRQIRDDFEDRLHVFKVKWPKRKDNALPDVIEQWREALAAIFADEMSDDELFTKSIEPVVEEPDELLSASSTETAEVKRPEVGFVPIQDEVADTGVAKLSAIREPYLEAKRQYRDLQHTLSEQERREFRSKLAILASAVQEAEDRHYNAFFADEIAPVPSPTPNPASVPTASLASVTAPKLTRGQIGGKVSAPVWRRVVAGLASSLKLDDE